MGELKTVYRFEHPSQEYGPYISGNHLSQDQKDLRYDLMEAHCGDNDHPGICDDVINEEASCNLRMGSDNLICACDSIDMLKYWFDGFFERLLQVGYRIKAYTMYSQDVYLCKSELQVCFNYKKRILKVDLTNTVSPL